ncbi:MAG: nitrogen regulation protein NR(II) [Vicinamibacterales bacterium]
MTPGTLGQRLSTHIALRLAVATALLGSAVIVQVRSPGAFPVNPLFVLIGVVYAVSLVFIATLRFVDRFPWLTDVHFAIDALLVSACIYLTGGVTSLFSSLYVLPIVAASTIQFRRGALQVAALSAVLYGGLVLAQFLEATGNLDPLFGVAMVVDLPSARVAQYTVGLNVFGFFAAAFLSGSLAERVRRADVRLEQASEAIADLQAFNQYVVDNLLSGLATADERNRLLTFNRAATIITGVSLANALGRDACEALQVPRELAETLPGTLARTRSHRIDVTYQRPDGGTIDLGLTVAQLPLPDGRRGYLYTFQDITEFKRLEQGAQLQRRLAAVGEMAAGIAHEIRNPLASMSGSMQMLRQELALTGDQAQLMDIVLRESDRLNETIRSFLAYARPQPIEVRRLDLGRILEETATLLRNSTEIGDAHEVEVDLPPDPVYLEADEGQVRQIVWNLSTNGLRAMPGGGRLHLAARLEAAADGALQPVLVVRDEGVGIPAQELDGIFQPFKGSFGKGTGLGLAIVYRIVSDYHGHIDVESSPGAGTTFRVVFPAPRRSAAARQAS